MKNESENAGNPVWERLSRQQATEDRCVVHCDRIERCDLCENLTRPHFSKGGKFCRECCTPCCRAFLATAGYQRRLDLGIEKAIALAKRTVTPAIDQASSAAQSAPETQDRPPQEEPKE
jgi:hypothetical protein